MPHGVADFALGAKTSFSPRGVKGYNFFVANQYGWSPMAGAIWNDVKFIRASRRELYNLKQDPNEEKQLYDASSQQSRELSTRFQSLVDDLAVRGRFAAGSVELAPTEFLKLRSLGYAASHADAVVGQVGTATDAPDPKDMVAVLGKIHAGTTALEEQRFREAVDLLIEVAATDDPGNPRAVRLLSMVVVDAPDERPRIVACLQQVRLRGGREMDEDILATLGVGLLGEQQYEAAVEVLNAVVQRAPHHAAAYCYLGDAQWQMQQFGDAARNYRRAIDLAAPLADPPDWLEHAKQQLNAVAERLP